ncbi:aldehyde dehydrogenase family protein [Streptomyces phaeoluteigriseus]|uniref:Aldehyde dehydrogenase family protein n=1 Tax=Streptomyces phaeoluteigriseus TaxID=114686 RepID=A0ABY4Z9T5_9ACTN|nr:aldehyde dehydrogenase family protein [Streptomyces phaeoluteigriseus]USQ85705.1 aldehyde dehydrogenase family protein [Streptomyces phaeoluteigriseus]
MTSLVDTVGLAGTVFSDGWRPASGAAVVEVLEPATGKALAQVGVADAADVARAAAGAARAQPTWGALPAAARAAVLRRAAAVLEDHRAEVAQWLIREGGAVRAKAETEIADTVEELLQAAALPTQPHGQVLPGAPGRSSEARRVPLGVVGVISPWNVPLLLALRSVAPALALGNAVILKPDVRTPVSGGLVVARLFEEAGLPEGVLHVLPGDAVAGGALTAEPKVAMVSFTGSTAVGREVGGVAGRALKRVSLELGGNNALIVLDDAGLAAAAVAGAFASFFHQGQICMAAGRHIVHASVAEEYVRRLVEEARRLTVGDPWTDGVDLGPMIDAGQLRRTQRIVRDSVAAGAEPRCGAEPDGPFYPPTVLTGVTRRMPAFTEEIFGPVAPVVVVRDDDEAVAVANDTEYGLVAAVRTGSVERGRRLADRLRTGMIHINDQTVNHQAVVPFGGFGASGNGARHGAQFAWDSYTQWQWITARSDEPA